MSKEVMQQALEALYSEDVDQQSWAKTALMKALSQPVQPSTKMENFLAIIRTSVERGEFSMEEILARLRALVRRAAGHASSELVCGPVSLDTANTKVTVDGKAIKLTSLEFRLLNYLMLHAGKVVSRTELVEHLYDQDFDRDSNTIEVFVGRLRKKLGVDVLQTIRGMGYTMSETGHAG